MKNIMQILLLALLGFLSSPLIGQETETIIIQEGDTTKKVTIEIIEENITDQEGQDDMEQETNITIKTRTIVDEDGNTVDEDGNILEDEPDFEFNFGNDDRDDDYEGKQCKEDRFRMLLLDIGINSYMYEGSLNLPSELDQFSLRYTGSYHINLHLFRHRLRIANSPLAFDYGLSVNWKHYRFENDFRITPEITELELVNIEDNVQKNKLRATYLELPMTLTLNPIGSKWTVSGGAYGYMRTGSSQRIKFDNEKDKIFDDFNLRPFGVGLIGRVGFGPLEFYAQYSLESLFNDGIVPALNPVSFGIAVLHF